MSNFQDLQGEVTRQKTVVTNAIAVLNGIPARVAAAVAAATSGGDVDQAAFDALVADIKSATDALEAAVNAVPAA